MLANTKRGGLCRLRLIVKPAETVVAWPISLLASEFAVRPAAKWSPFPERQCRQVRRHRRDLVGQNSVGPGRVDGSETNDRGTRSGQNETRLLRHQGHLVLRQRIDPTNCLTNGKLPVREISTSFH